MKHSNMNLAAIQKLAQSYVLFDVDKFDTHYVARTLVNGTVTSYLMCGDKDAREGYAVARAQYLEKKVSRARFTEALTTGSFRPFITPLASENEFFAFIVSHMCPDNAAEESE